MIARHAEDCQNHPLIVEEIESVADRAEQVIDIFENVALFISSTTPSRSHSAAELSLTLGRRVKRRPAATLPATRKLLPLPGGSFFKPARIRASFNPGFG